jgi:hypothetical protein
LLLDEDLRLGELGEVKKYNRADAGGYGEFFLKYFDVDSRFFNKVKRNIELNQIIGRVEKDVPL